MRRCCLFVVAVAVLIGGVAVPRASAITITAEALADPVTIGSQVEVVLSISGLAPGAPSLGAYDIDLGFDSALLSLAGVTFGDPILGNQVQLIVPGFSGTGPGVGTSVNLFEVSLDAPATLDAMQADSFVLASVLFDTIGLGTSLLPIVVNVVGDANGVALAVASIGDSVTVAAVPEPSLVVLALTGLTAAAARSTQRYARPGRLPREGR